MAVLNAIRRRQTIHDTQVDIEAVRHSVQLRLAGRPVRSDRLARSVQAHAEAIGRGEPSVSPFKVRVLKNG